MKLFCLLSFYIDDIDSVNKLLPQLVFAKYFLQIDSSKINQNINDLMMFIQLIMNVVIKTSGKI